MEKMNKESLEVKSRVFKAMGHPTRLWMVESLRDGERCVCEFVDALDVDFSTVSKHLSVLRNAGIVEIDKRGKQVFYKLKMPCVANFIVCVDEAVSR